MISESEREDMANVASLLRQAMLDCDEVSLRAILSNNINMIIGALMDASNSEKVCETCDEWWTYSGSQTHGKCRLLATSNTGPDGSDRHWSQTCEKWTPKGAWMRNLPGSRDA